MKTACSHLMPLQQHLYNGLARPADYFIFAREWNRRLQVSLRWLRNGLAPTNSVAGIRDVTSIIY